MGRYIGDDASAKSVELQDDQIQQIIDGQIEIDDTSETLQRDRENSILSRITFRWHDSDRLIVDQIRAATEYMLETQFQDLFKIIDNLYMEMRVPEQDHNGIVRLDQAQRPIWKKNPETGSIIETTDQLTGQDLEKAILDLNNLELVVAEQTSQLLGEAVFAKMIEKEKSDEHWTKIVDGTIDDRRARVNRVAVIEKYHAFYRWWLWQYSDTFLREIRRQANTLDNILKGRIYSQRS